MEIDAYKSNGKYHQTIKTKKALELLNKGLAKSIDLHSIIYKYNQTPFKQVRERIINKYNRICYICGYNIPPEEEATIDHIIPRTRDYRAYQEVNLRCCCNRCNNDKSNYTLREYLQYISGNRNKYSYISKKKIRKLNKFAIWHEKTYFRN